MATTAERLKEAMKMSNMKQVDIVEKTGISKGALSSYISGSYEPKQENLYKIAKALDVNEAWLMGHEVARERMQSKVDHPNENAKAKYLQLYIQCLGYTMFRDDPEHPPFIKTDGKIYSLSYSEQEKLFDSAESYIKFSIDEILKNKTQ